MKENKELCILTKKMWESYILGDLSDVFLDNECVIIGTGRHEFYRSLKEFEQAFELEMHDRENIKFQFKDFWCKQKMLSEDIGMTYGGLHIYWESDDHQIYINMESRFTCVYHKIDNQWRVVHVHQSMPNLEQTDNEYYPKTLSDQVKESYDKIETLTTLANRDGLTQLLNYRTFKEIYVNWTFEKTWLFIIDIDKFKMINDKYGHVMGNRVLCSVAKSLESMLRHHDVVCRMGGDEFLVLCNGFEHIEIVEEFIERMQDYVAKHLDCDIEWYGLSIGKTCVDDNEDLDDVITRADRDLYEHKKINKFENKIMR